MTGTNQASGAATELLADELGNDLMEITAHYGARPEHAAWQGKIVSRSGRRGYLSLSDIGYGEVTGFMGANCRHNWFPYLEGSEPSYSRYELEQFKNDTVTFEGKKYTAYEATQKQREYERSIRNTKERIAGYDAAGLKDEMTTQSVRLRRLKNGYKDLCAQTGLKPRSSALQASPYSGFTRSTASKAVWAERRATERLSYINKTKPKLPKVASSNNAVLQDTVDVGSPLVTGVVPKGVELTKVYIIAGYGTSTKLRAAKSFASTYGGEDWKWQKKTGIINTDNFSYEVHWNEYGGKQYLSKLKKVKPI